MCLKYNLNDLRLLFLIFSYGNTVDGYSFHLLNSILVNLDSNLVINSSTPITSTVLMFVKSLKNRKDTKIHSNNQMTRFTSSKSAM